MTKPNAVDWLLVGAGDIAAKRVAPALAETRPGRLLGVCDAAAPRAAALAAQYGAAEVFADFDEALSKTAANAVYVATPVLLHAEFATRAMAAGKHVLVEKPLGLTAQDASQAVAAAAGAGVVAGCSYYRRFYPCYRHAAEMLASGEFGRIVLVRMTYFSWFNPDPDDPKYWRVVRAKSGGGPLSDMGTHMFDVLIGLLGMPCKVRAKARTLVQPYEVEDAAVALMELDGGADLVATFHWNSKTWSHEFEIIGTEAKVKWHPYDAGKVVKTVGRDVKELELPNAENVHAPLIRDFVQAVVEGREPAVPLAEAARTNVLLDAVYRSAETGKEVAL